MKDVPYVCCYQEHGGTGNSLSLISIQISYSWYEIQIMNAIFKNYLPQHMAFLYLIRSDHRRSLYTF